MHARSMIHDTIIKIKNVRTNLAMTSGTDDEENDQKMTVEQELKVI